MFKKLIVLLFILCNVFAFSQQKPNFGAEKSHEYYVKQLNNSKDKNFEEIKRSYRIHIANRPNDISAQIELCKFIGNSYWDEDYNLKYEETEECIAYLFEKYPVNPKVLIYRAENLYGNDKLEVLKTAEDRIETNTNEWSDIEIATINNMLGEQYEDENWRALVYYKKAQRLNDSLDLSLQIAELYKAKGDTEKATTILLSKLEKDTLVWKMNQKAELLLELNQPQKALDLYDIIRKRDSSYIDNAEIAKAMTNIGNHEAARKFLVKDTINEWNRINTIQNLLQYDIAHSDAEIALNTYRKLQENNSYDDFFGIKRLRISFKNPFLAWKASEIAHLFLLFLVLLIAFLIPYLWISPVYGLGLFLKKNNVGITPKLPFKWNMKHFWVISFFYVMVQVIVILVLAYQETINYYFDIGGYAEESIDTRLLASEMILFVALMAISTLTVLGRKKIRDVFRTNLRIRQMIGLGILFVVFNRIFIKILGFFVDLQEPTISLNTIFSVQEEIMATMSHHGFLVTAILVALVVPIYEEVIFRGVILGSVEKHIGFNGANVIQAILFALVHDNLKLFPFFFLFAIITGYWVRKSGGLLTGIFFHGIHNLAIVTALYYLTKISLFGG